jgi:hypothetical protein
MPGPNAVVDGGRIGGRAVRHPESCPVSVRGGVTDRCRGRAHCWKGKEQCDDNWSDRCGREPQTRASGTPSRPRQIQGSAFTYQPFRQGESASGGHPVLADKPSVWTNPPGGIGVSNELLLRVQSRPAVPPRLPGEGKGLAPTRWKVERRQSTRFRRAKQTSDRRHRSGGHPGPRLG